MKNVSDVNISTASKANIGNGKSIEDIRKAFEIVVKKVETLTDERNI